MSFTGFPVAALDFYDDLEMDNTKSFWEANKHVYKEAVEAPMKALAAALEPEFGSMKIFRPYRDVRFAKDKTPYKTHQGAFVAAGPRTGWYVEISARGTRVGAGFYEADGPTLAAIRDAMADQRTVRRDRRRSGRPGARGLEGAAPPGQLASRRRLSLQRSSARRRQFTSPTPGRGRLAPWPRDCSCCTSARTPSTCRR